MVVSSSSSLFSKNNIDVLVVSCSADCSHINHLGSMAGTQIPNEPVRGVDYLEVAMPGTFPTSEGLVNIESLILRFGVKQIIVITHSGCGAVIAVEKVLEDPSMELEIFDGPGKYFVDEFKAQGITPTLDSENLYNDIAHAQAVVVSKYLKDQLEVFKSQRIKNSENDFVRVLDGISIKGFVSLPPIDEPQKVIEI